jgi:predicted transcriptional regulator
MAKKIGTSITIHPEVKGKIEREAKRTKRSFSSLTEIACDEYIKKNNLK